jgi:hypothetical protein
MKVRNKLLSFVSGIAVMLFISCSSIGQHLPLSSNDIVIGTIQTTFVARDTWLSKNESINAQVYIKLLEAAAQKYPGTIDIREIVWVTGRTVGPRDTEVSATAKVIRIDPDETSN